jgi:polysaccharide biosynthesis/export protein
MGSGEEIDGQERAFVTGPTVLERYFVSRGIRIKTGLSALTIAILASPFASAADRLGTAEANVGRPSGANDQTTSYSGEAAEDYQIGAGDVLQVSVWKEPDASIPSVIVRPDGKIAMPLLKEVEVAGMTPKQVEKVITERLSGLINAPEVTVVVTAINSKRVYVLGAVKKEGPLSYTYRMNVIQALSEAGGLTEYAKRKKIYVLRNESGKDHRLLFNYDEVIRGEKMEQNILLLPGDTLVIPH